MRHVQQTSPNKGLSICQYSPLLTPLLSLHTFMISQTCCSQKIEKCTELRLLNDLGGGILDAAHSEGSKIGWEEVGEEDSLDSGGYAILLQWFQYAEVGNLHSMACMSSTVLGVRKSGGKRPSRVIFGWSCAHLAEGLIWPLTN